MGLDTMYAFTWLYVMLILPHLVIQIEVTLLKFLELRDHFQTNAL